MRSPASDKSGSEKVFKQSRIKKLDLKSNYSFIILFFFINRSVTSKVIISLTTSIVRRR